MCVLPYFAIAIQAIKPSALGLTLRAIWLMRLGNIATAEDFHYTANPFRRQYKIRGGCYGLSPTKKAHFLLDAGSAGGPKAPKCFIHKEIKIMRFYLTGSIRYCII